jgi:phage terminase large subunit
LENEIRVPQILNIPEKMRPMIISLDDYRYVLAEGGRGGSKSQSISRFILFLAERYKLRIVCGRETQNSITESVYSIFTDLIRAYNLTEFTVLATRIDHKNGSTINFRGFREQGRFNIQGMEGVDILWIDEAQAITKDTLDSLIPTIRKNKAKIFFSMNRHVEDDPVYSAFYGREDCLHININFYENEFCPDALKREAEECKKKSVEDYNHIWLGHPLGRGSDFLFARNDILSVEEYNIREGYGARIGGFDVARYGDDKSAAVVVQQQGALHWTECFIDQWGDKDLSHTTGRILEIHNEEECNHSVIDEDGIGSGPLDILVKGRGMEDIEGFRNVKLAYSDDKDYANTRTKAAYKTKELISRGHLKIKDKELIDELCLIRYTYDHNQRRILISKEQMKKDGVKSPNKADALFYAVSKIHEFKAKQDTKYYHRHPQYSKEENLYKLAGVI